MLTAPSRELKPSDQPAVAEFEKPTLPATTARFSTRSVAMVGSLLMWAALPPLDLWPLAWIAPVPWLLLIRQERLTGRRPYRTIWLAGFLFWMGVLHWIRLPFWADAFGWLALSIYLAFYIPVFVGLTRVAVHRLGISMIVAAPIVWTGLELAKGQLLSGFTMGSLGHTQFRWLAFIQAADIVSGYGIGGLVILGAACIARMIPWDSRRWSLWPLAPVVAMFAMTLIYGHLRIAALADPDARTARVALVQGSTDITMKMNPGAAQEIFNDYLRLSRQAVIQAARDSDRPLDLIVWPETMFRGSLHSFEPGFRPNDAVSQSDVDKYVEGTKLATELLATTARELGAPLLIGLGRTHWLAGGRSKHFNTAQFVAADGGLLGHYDKMHLVMFGEYVPLADQFPFLYSLTPLPGGLTPGKAPYSEEVHDLHYAPNICYETTIPHVIRRQVNEAASGEEPDVLVNLTNDGWFWGSSELDLHLMCSVFRAIECRKPVLIAANTGFSAWIDATGRIVKQAKRHDEDIIIADVQRGPGGSFYLHFGDLPSLVCLLACGGLAIVGLWAGCHVASPQRRDAGH
jgi:apolipoprotein N-acyltransferase